MGMNESKGNMYEFVTHTWNTIKGKCLHNCSYCYMKKFKLNDLRFDESELKTDLGSGNFIFVGSSCDMWAKDVDMKWILATLNKCKKHDGNKYLFQSKNPMEFTYYLQYIKDDSILGTTIETNRHYEEMGNAPPIIDRVVAMNRLSSILFRTMVTIEPIMDFDLMELAYAIELCKPDWVNIGADSKASNLPEPSKEKIEALIHILQDMKIKVIEKSNLKRLYNAKTS